MIGGFLAKALEAILRIGMAFFAIKKLGIQKEKIEQLESKVKTSDEANKIDNLVEFDPNYRVRVRREFDGQ